MRGQLVFLSSLSVQVFEPRLADGARGHQFAAQGSGDSFHFIAAVAAALNRKNKHNAERRCQHDKACQQQLIARKKS